MAEIATCKNLFVLENITMVMANQLLGNVGGAKSIHFSSTTQNNILVDSNSVVVAYDRTASKANLKA